MKREKYLTAFLGVEGSGKTTEAQKLVDLGYTSLSIADYIRDKTWNMLRYKPLSEHEYNIFKSTRIGLNKNTIFERPSCLGRNILESIGSIICEIDSNFLCSKVLDNILESNKSKFCLVDLRKQHELKFFIEECKKNSIIFQVIFCDYKSKRYNNKNTHESAILSNHLSNIYDHLSDITEHLPTIVNMNLESN